VGTHEEVATEIVLEQIHQTLVETKDFLEDLDTKKGNRLLGKVELVLSNWDDDALASELEEEDDDEGEDDGGSLLEALADEGLLDEDDEPYDDEDDDDE
jgi:hypothetical protein